MRYKVELRYVVCSFLKRECSPEDRAAFYDALERTRDAPIENSEAITDPELSRFVLRFFRFGTYIAIFEFHPAEGRMVVRKCRNLQKGANGRHGLRP